MEIKVRMGLLLGAALLQACSSGGGKGKAAGAPSAGGSAHPSAFHPTKHVEIILDASGSMGAVSENERKIDTAKHMLSLITQSLQGEEAAVSLTAFGHRKSWSCNDIERIYDMEYKTAQEIEDKVKAISPAERGKTPIATALQLSYARLKKVKGPKAIFVITDGAETCHGDPCKIAKKLRKELDVDVYTLTYKPTSVEEFKSLACLGNKSKVLIAKNKNDLFDKMAQLKQAMDKDNARKMEGLETVQTIKVLGPVREAWATAKNKETGKEFRFLGMMGTSLPVGSYDVTVHYNPVVTFEGIDLKEKEQKTLTVVGEGSLILEIDFPGVELEAMNLLDSQKYRVMAGAEAKVPVGRYNVSGMTASGLAFQWQDQIVTPGSLTKLNLPNWALLEVHTETPITFDLFRYLDPNIPEKTVKVSNPGVGSVKQYKDSLGFYSTNAPHVIEGGEYTAILSDGRRIGHIELKKGDKRTELLNKN